VLVRQTPERDDLVDRRRERQRRDLRHDGDTASDRQAVEGGHGPSVELDGADRRLDEPGDRPQQGRLAGPVRTDERDALATIDVQVQVAQRRAAAVGDGHAFEMDHSS